MVDAKIRLVPSLQSEIIMQRKFQQLIAKLDFRYGGPSLRLNNNNARLSFHSQPLF